MHAEVRKAYLRDKEKQEGGGGTLANRAVRFNEIATVHYTEERSSVAAAKAPLPKAPPSSLPDGSGRVWVFPNPQAATDSGGERANWTQHPWNGWKSNDEWWSR